MGEDAVMFRERHARFRRREEVHEFVEVRYNDVGGIKSVSFLRVYRGNFSVRGVYEKQPLMLQSRRIR